MNREIAIASRKTRSKALIIGFSGSGLGWEWDQGLRDTRALACGKSGFLAEHQCHASQRNDIAGEKGGLPDTASVDEGPAGGF
jgi:hypothetical protein